MTRRGAVRRSGAVLLLVLVLVPVLALGGYAFTHWMRAEARASVVALRQVKARWLADSGIDLALAYLSDPQNFEPGEIDWEDDSQRFAAQLIYEDANGLRGLVSLIVSAEDGSGVTYGMENQSAKIPLHNSQLVVKWKEDNQTLMRLPGMTETLADAMTGMDVFIGVSAADCVTPEMIQSMADRPIAFTMANPNPEIAHDLAMECRPEILLSTGRSDYPNQVNNLLAFPGVFRGALDTLSSDINEPMKVAAARAIAGLIPSHELTPENFIPSALNPLVAREVAWAVAKVAMESGVARKQVELDSYRRELLIRLTKEGPA